LMLGQGGRHDGACCLVHGQGRTLCQGFHKGRHVEETKKCELGRRERRGEKKLLEISFYVGEENQTPTVSQSNESF
jgi:hypothetical protein